MTYYRVKWKRGQPYIDIGKSVIVGKKRNTKKVQWESDSKKESLQTAAHSIQKAVENEIARLGFWYGNDYLLQKSPPAVFRHEPDPWLLAGTISRLMRLARKLEKQHLMKVIRK